MKTEQERHQEADIAASHLPKVRDPISVSNADEAAMRAAFKKRFNEELPRTETLYAVAAIGYRMAMRDLTQ
jgi:hypothetical protein